MRDTISIKRNSIASELASTIMVCDLNKDVAMSIDLDKVLFSCLKIKAKNGANLIRNGFARINKLKVKNVGLF